MKLKALLLAVGLATTTPAWAGQPVTINNAQNTHAAAVNSANELTVDCTTGCTGGGAVTATITGPLGTGTAASGVRVTQSATDAANLAGIVPAINAAACTAPCGVKIAYTTTTPAAGTAHILTTGGSAVTLVTGPVQGCYILNPLTAADQNIATAEVAYVNPVTTATQNSTNGSSTALQPGQSFNCIPGMTTNVSGIAATNSHNLVVIAW